MKTVVRRLMLGVVVCALLLLNSPLARAQQAMKNLPADALVVIKVNRPAAVNEKVKALAAKLGLDRRVPVLQDPLGALQQELKLKDGIDFNGEFAIAFYDSGGAEPNAVALIPVTDYAAFLKGMSNVKKEGELDAFNWADVPDTFYSAHWGNFAAITPTKELLAKRPEGIQVAAGAAAKALDSGDVVLFANAAVIGAKLLPQFKEAKPALLDEAAQNLAQLPLDPKMQGVLKAVVSQALNAVEETLADGRAATMSLTLGDAGINYSVVADFKPNTYIGDLMAKGKNTDASLLKGLPSDRKYFFFGGTVQDPAQATKLWDDLVGPVAKELAGAGDQARHLIAMLDSMKTQMTSTTGMSMGYVRPQGGLGAEPLMQAIAVVHGDSKKLGGAYQQYMQAYANLMGAMQPEGAPMSMTTESKAGAATVDGVTFDLVTMKMKMDPNQPGMAEAQMAMGLMMGPEGMTTYTGAVDDDTLLMVMGSRGLLAPAVTAAKKGDDALAQVPHIKAVNDALPRNRSAVFFLAVDNILGTVMDAARQFQAPIPPIRIPDTMAPLGFAVGTEGTALRIDVHVPTDLLEKAASIVMQVEEQMQRGGGGGNL